MRVPTAQLRFARRAAGFTMIEVMIVVVLLAITAAIAMPMVGNRSDLKLAAAARTMVGDLQYAQNYAVATRQGIYVKFEANKYTLCKKTGSTLVAITHPIDRGNFVVQFNGKGSSALGGVTLAVPNFSGDSILMFDSVGSPFSYSELTTNKAALASRGSLTLTCGSVTQKVHVEPYTGEVSVP